MGDSLSYLDNLSSGAIVRQGGGGEFFFVAYRYKCSLKELCPFSRCGLKYAYYILYRCCPLLSDFPVLSTWLRLITNNCCVKIMKQNARANKKWLVQKLLTL